MLEIAAIAHTWDGRALPSSQIIHCTLERQDRHLIWRIDAPYYGDPAPDHPVGPTPGLWNHEVVELFIGQDPFTDGDYEYSEIECSPHGHHLIVQIRGIRRIIRQCLPMDYHATIGSERWTATAHIPLDLLPQGRWRYNLCSIHGTGHARCYCSMVTLPGAYADFHRPGRYKVPDAPIGGVR